MEYIKILADELVKKYNTRDPFEVIEGEGIHLIFNYEFTDLKGFYSVMNKKRYIVINGNLNDSTKKTVAAHELGHDLLHRCFSENSILSEISLFDLDKRQEYEANLFAADFLISDEEILSAAKNGNSVFETAELLSKDVNLVNIKLKSMNNRGFHLNMGLNIASDFLKGM